ncbi:MAG: DNA mismatch repair protein MutS, partial [Clostridia bacterium]|nr:DNA mismatch repair protein MutS [Clostridia bacterium]
LDAVKNYRILVNEVGDKVVFLHRIARGATNKSFGIEVAGLAGVPKSVTDRAKEIAKQLEQHKLGDTNTIMLDAMGGSSQEQMSMFGGEDPKQQEILAVLKDTAVERLTPMQAMVILDDLVKKAKGV